MGLGGHEPGREPPRPVRTSSSTMLYERPYSHTHTCTHTNITRCMHLLCTARVHTLQFFTPQVSRLHSMRSCIRMLMMHSHIHLPTHTHIFIHTHITTLADTSAISLATTSQHSQTNSKSNLNHTRTHFCKCE